MIQVRVGRRLVDHLDNLAEEFEITRAELIRQVLRSGVTDLEEELESDEEEEEGDEDEEEE